MVKINQLLSCFDPSHLFFENGSRLVELVIYRPVLGEGYIVKIVWVGQVALLDDAGATKGVNIIFIVGGPKEEEVTLELIHRNNVHLIQHGI